MPQSKVHDPCDLMRDQIEARLDEELSEFQTASFDRHVDSCPECALDLELAKQVRADLLDLNLRNLEQDPERYRCPQRVVDAVYAVARQDLSDQDLADQARREASRKEPGWLATFWNELRQPGLRPAFAGALLIVALIAIPIALERPAGSIGSAANEALSADSQFGSEVELTAEEIERVEQETRLALAYLGKIGRQVETKMRMDVLGEAMQAAERIGSDSAGSANQNGQVL